MLTLFGCILHFELMVGKTPSCLLEATLAAFSKPILTEPLAPPLGRESCLKMEFRSSLEECLLCTFFSVCVPVLAMWYVAECSLKRDT